MHTKRLPSWLTFLLLCAACAASLPEAEAATGSSFRGMVSYYSDSLSGRPTASGEPYNPRELTAASRTLPFGTRVRVIRTDGSERGREVIVRINDRGPFGSRQRVLDLSRAAAEELRMVRDGVVRVRVEVLAVPRRSRR